MLVIEDPEDPEQPDDEDPLADLEQGFSDGGPAESGEASEASPRTTQPRLILVDVASVVEGGDPLRSLWQQSRAEAAERFVDLLAWAMAADDSELVLVLDRSASSPELLQGTHGMRLQLTTPRQSVAEALFEAMDEAGNMGRAATVVTSDIDVIRRAAECQMQAVLGDLFAVSLLGGVSRAEEDDFTEPPGLGAREKAEWQAFVARWQKEKKG